MINAKDEFIEATSGKAKVKAAFVTKLGFYNKKQKFVLNEGYTEEQFKDFLELINFTYDHGYGSQELEGIIWYEDGTWSERGEYDGSEWWEYKKCPVIGDILGK